MPVRCHGILETIIVLACVNIKCTQILSQTSYQTSRSTSSPLCRILLDGAHFIHNPNIIQPQFHHVGEPHPRHGEHDMVVRPVGAWFSVRHEIEHLIAMFSRHSPL